MYKEQSKLPLLTAGKGLNLDSCSRDALPPDWDITGVFGDILMCEFADENVSGEVIRSGIYVKTDVTNNLWRTVKILMKGPGATDNVSVGDYVIMPNDRGIRGMSKGGKKIVFVNEDRLFCKVAPVKTD